VLKELNEMHENLEFTLENEKDGKLPFLDIMHGSLEATLGFEAGDGCWVMSGVPKHSF
jgi:hypothetical protein